MHLEPHASEALQKAGIKRGKTVLDFGCGSGTYTIPAAKIAGKEGKVYALDKDKKVLDELMQKAEYAGLENIKRIDTSGDCVPRSCTRDEGLAPRSLLAGAGFKPP